MCFRIFVISFPDLDVSFGGVVAPSFIHDFVFSLLYFALCKSLLLLKKLVLTWIRNELVNIPCNIAAVSSDVKNGHCALLLKYYICENMILSDHEIRGFSAERML